MNEQKSKMKRSNPSPAAEGKSRRMESSEKSSGSKGDPLKKSSEKLSSPKSKESAAKHPYKTKWEPTTSSDASVQICPPKKEEALQPPGPPVRIKDLLDNKEKIVDHLFRTVTGTALEELIPDYLKNYSIEELKALCVAQIKNLTTDEILQILSGKLLERENSGQKSPDDRTSTADPSPDMAGSFSNDVLELNPSSNEMKCITEEENQSLLSIEEVSKDLPVHEKDSDLLELEMRARAIRSLLKAKSEDADPEEPRKTNNEFTTRTPYYALKTKPLIFSH